MTTDRKPNFTRIEEEEIVEEYIKRKETLESKFSSSVTQQKKRKAWKEIADFLNSKNINVIRTGDEIKKKYKNIVQSAKKKSAEIKHPKTGGGPKPTEPSAAEEKILDFYDGRQCLEGLPDGLDTAVSLSLVECSETSLVQLVENAETQAQPLPAAVGLQLQEFLESEVNEEKNLSAKQTTTKPTKRKPEKSTETLWREYLVQATATLKAKEDVLKLKKKLLLKH